MIIEEGKMFQLIGVSSKKGIFALSEIVGISGLVTVFPGSLGLKAVIIESQAWFLRKPVAGLGIE